MTCRIHYVVNCQAHYEMKMQDSLFKASSERESGDSSAFNKHVGLS